MLSLPRVASLLPSGKAALRLAAGTASLATGGWLLRALNDAPASLGAGPGGIRPVADRSPNYREGVFHNLEPAAPLKLDAEENRLVLFDMLSRSSASRPAGTIPLVHSAAPISSEPLAVTWLGHSTALVEIDGYRVLTDPVWSDRCSPSRTVGPARLHPVPAPLEALPALDAVVISHDHYDHLDMDTVLALARTQRAPFVVPLGVGAHLRQWRIPPERIIELDWNEQARIGDLRLVCTPARHFSGRFLSRNTTLWSSWAIIGPQHRAYFGGDTGYTRSFEQIGADHGPFDLTLMPIGAYNTAWPDIHMNPEEAVRAHRDVSDAGLLVPIHWCTFRLAPHPWAEPVERLLVSAGDAGVRTAVPRPGGRVVTATAGTIDRWWEL
ncbi:MBL fold metallo-hydrolase [Mycolicibacterium vinylchloridicum]|uniref:MBL fold metallo-hydrolase n=1 Tax=Mycolicibacterium vinylchloridicum TaxID=2736928 RepID=UPI002D7FD32E|nr:MBL fold metallo-hydrolase [Mycolicibacterium vinylchloridicum]